MNVVTTTINKIPKLCGANQEKYHEWSLKTRVASYISNGDVLDVMISLIKPALIITGGDTPDPPRNILKVQG